MKELAFRRFLSAILPGLFLGLFTCASELTTARAGEDPNPLGPPIEETVTEEKPAKKLFGAVQHSDSLPAVPETLRKGARMSPAIKKCLIPAMKMQIKLKNAATAI